MKNNKGGNNYLHYEKLAQEPATKLDIDSLEAPQHSPGSKKGKSLLSQDSLAVSVYAEGVLISQLVNHVYSNRQMGHGRNSSNQKFTHKLAAIKVAFRAYHHHQQAPWPRAEIKL